MKKLITLTAALCLGGCTTIEKVVDSIPQHEFDRFTYGRAGNTSSGSITAEGARFEEGKHVIDFIEAQHSNRITGSIGFSYEGLKRPAKVQATSQTGGVK